MPVPDQVLYQPDPSIQFPVLSDLLHCSEENHPNDDGENEGAVEFSCTVAQQRLVLRCRDASSGLLLSSEPTAHPDTSGAVDPFFFDANYDLAGKTGFQIWPGSRLMTEALTCGDFLQKQPIQHHHQQNHQHHPVLDRLQEQIRTGARVLELGSGIGLVGIALAAAGAQVLLTDLPTLVNNAIAPNIARNATSASAASPAAASSLSPIWIRNAVAVGRGSAHAAVLDWMKPWADQMDNVTDADATASTIDLVVSCDGLWLKHMLESILNVLDSVFAAAAAPPPFIFTYQRRGKNEMFTTLEGVLDAMQCRGWTTECLAWRMVHCGKNEDGSDEVNQLFLFRTTSKCSN